MRALPQIDLHPQPAPVQADTPARHSGRSDGDDFAQTLQRRTSAEDPPAHPAEQPAERSPSAEKTAPKESTPDSAKGPSDHQVDAASTTSADDTDTAGVIAAPIPGEVTVDPELAALLAAPLVPATTQPDAAAVAVTAGDPLAALMALGDRPTVLVPAAVPGLTPTASMVTDASIVPAVPGITAPSSVSTATDPAAANIPTVNTVIAPAANGEAAPTADLTVLASTAPTLAPVASQPLTKAGDASVPPTASSIGTTTELPVNAALPPVVAMDGAVKTALTGKDGMPTAPGADAPASIVPTLSTTTPVTAATPAAQSAGMHAVAAAIGERDAKDGKSQDVAGITVKTTGELAAPAAPQPTNPVTPTKPVSETVLAQNTLAQQGNAMEKAVSHQVSKALVQHLPGGDRMMVLRLTPPELGTVKIEVIERQGVLSARLHAEDDGVRLALERFLPSMRQDLRASDAPIRELTLSDQTQFQRSFADGQQQGQQQDANRPGNRRTRDDGPRFSLDGVRQEPVAVPRSAPLGGRVSLSGVDALA